VKKTILLSTGAAILLASAASAQDSKWNLGAGYTFLDTDVAELNAFNVRGDYALTDYLSAEGELIVGLGNEDIVLGNASGDLSLDYGFGLYAKASFPLNETISAFGRVGYVYHEYDNSIANATFNNVEDGLAFGAGLEWSLTGPHTLRADYTRFEYDGGVDADAFSIGYAYRF